MLPHVTVFASAAAGHFRQHLTGFRHSLMRLHKALVDHERISFERVHGRIASSGEWLQLVIHHEWFAWLRPLSELIVQMDEALSEEEPAASGHVTNTLAQARALLRPNELGVGFNRQYFGVLQDDPEVALAHAEATKFLKANAAEDGSL